MHVYLYLYGAQFLGAMRQSMYQAHSVPKGVWGPNHEAYLPSLRRGHETPNQAIQKSRGVINF